VKKEIASVNGEVTAVENLGKKDFVRVTDRKFTSATYVQISFAAPPEGPAQLKERLRLNNNVYRTFVETV
jgi:small subunit ribosomal protein S6